MKDNGNYKEIFYQLINRYSIGIPAEKAISDIKQIAPIFSVKNKPIPVQNNLNEWILIVEVEINSEYVIMKKIEYNNLSKQLNEVQEQYQKIKSESEKKTSLIAEFSNETITVKKNMAELEIKLKKKEEFEKFTNENIAKLQENINKLELELISKNKLIQEIITKNQDQKLNSKNTDYDNKSYEFNKESYQKILELNNKISEKTHLESENRILKSELSKHKEMLVNYQKIAPDHKLLKRLSLYIEISETRKEALSLRKQLDELSQKIFSDYNKIHKLEEALHSTFMCYAPIAIGLLLDNFVKIYCKAHECELSKNADKICKIMNTNSVSDGEPSIHDIISHISVCVFNNMKFEHNVSIQILNLREKMNFMINTYGGGNIITTENYDEELIKAVVIFINKHDPSYIKKIAMAEIIKINGDRDSIYNLPKLYEFNENNK